VVGYVRCNRRWVVAGAPVCAEHDLPVAADELEQAARRTGDRVVYFGAEDRLSHIYHGRPTHSRISLGAQPTWHPAHWASIVARHASVRAQLRRARNKDVRVELWPRTQAERHPALERCLREWLATRPLPPLHFLVEPDTLGTLHDRTVFVAVRGGIPVGFLMASPIPARRGWLIEQFVRGIDAPNGTAELMIDTAVRWMAAQNAEYVTLGLAPLSNHAGIDARATEPLWLRFAFNWTHAHGRRFYNFDGLDAFKAKFNPERWEPAYAIANEHSFSPRSLLAIASAFTNGAPIRTALRGLGRAVQQEIAWVVR
jgi:phosphatidylglycerol lysyltransferase